MKKWRPTVSGRYVLMNLYVSAGVASDQLASQRDILQSLLQSYEEQTGDEPTADEVIAYLINERKCGRLPRLGDAA